MPGRIVLHVGTHKTGTTSLQRFLRDHDLDLLAAVGGHYPPGFLLPDLHSELPLLTVDPERTWPARLRLPETRAPGWLTAAAAHVRTQVNEVAQKTLVYSHEDLSYLRSASEMDRLRDLLHGRQVDVVVFLREPTSFLRSYRDQLTAMGFASSDDPTSFAYVEDDSWLVDYDGLLAGYRQAFGTSHVRSFDYDLVLQRDGSVIPTVTDLLGIERSSLPPLEPYFLNKGGTQRPLTDAQLEPIRRRVAKQAEG